MTTLICDCNRTMPLQPEALGQALGETLTLHSTLCRREAGAFQAAIRDGQDVVVACTQEKRLFGELGGATQGAVSPVRFVNIRETGGWSRDAAQAMPKLAALLAAAHLPEPDPVATVTYKSGGRLLIIGSLDQAEQAAALLDDVLDVTLFGQGPGRAGGAQERRYPVLSGRIDSLQGWLGAFELRWTRGNPIDLDLCTRCNACISACPDGAIGLDYQVDTARCTSHRACEQACTVAGAIDFSRSPENFTDQYDLVLDLGGTPLFTQHAPPQGYFAWGGQAPPRPCCVCASWSANSKSPNSSTTASNCARIAATKPSAAAPVSISARRAPSAATATTSASSSIPACASGAGPAPPSAPAAR